ncbi:MAG: DUF3473 domain-containing protein, partial [Gemmatimonadota bacterium]
MPSITNILTFDVEDWHQSTLDHDLPITGRVRDNTMRIMDMLAPAGIRATFFVLGLVAEKFPDLVRAIGVAGHEVATHGHSHRPVYEMTPDQFRADLRRSIVLIEQEAGERVVGYRAPDFSIPANTLWALEILAEEGMRYDSSLFPFRGPRYGIDAPFTLPWRVRCKAAGLVEFPLTTTQYLGRRFPAGGGGYFRLLPYAHTRRAIVGMNLVGSPATAYFHPYEIDAEEIRLSTHRIPLRLRLSQGLGRRRTAGRLARLLREFSWGTARDQLTSEPSLTGDRRLDLTA